MNQINLRWTEVYTQQGQLVLIPNKQVFENPIMNYSSLGRRRIDLNVGVSFGDDLVKAKEVAIRAVEGVPERLAERPIELYYEEIGESAISFVVRFWVPFSKQADYLAARSEAIIRIKQAFDAEGITMPFPTRTLDFGVQGARRSARFWEVWGYRRKSHGHPTERHNRSLDRQPSSLQSSALRRLVSKI